MQKLTRESGIDDTIELINNTIEKLTRESGIDDMIELINNPRPTRQRK